MYSSSPKVRTRQVRSDLLVAVWCASWFWSGHEIYQLLTKLGGAGRLLQDASSDVNVSSRLPGVFRSPAEKLDSFGQGLNRAGELQASAAHDVALAIGLLVALLPAAPILLRHVLKRLAWIRGANAVAELRRSPDFTRLMAQRALMRQPLHRLMKASPTPLEDFAAGNHEALAELEYEEFGLHKRPHPRNESPPVVDGIS